MRIKREIVNNKLKCSKCPYWLPLDDFHNCKESPVGKKAYCKVCSRNYDKKRRGTKLPFNSGIIGVYLFKCEHCKQDFITKKANKTFCSSKCRKRFWYEQNQQTETAKKYGNSRSHLNFKKDNKWKIF